MTTRASLPLDPSFYSLAEDELAFFKTQTGIQNNEKLKVHILKVQAEAYAVYPYPCIRRFGFTEFKILRYPAYGAILKLGRERKDALLLDLGCCFGQDVRKVISDGFPQENVVASDLHKDFWDLGNKLFKTSSEDFPVCFLPGDIFDPVFLSPDASPAPSSKVSDLGPAPSLSTLTSLTPLQHRISVIHTSSFFHLFTKDRQRNLAHLLATLLSPLPGSMIVGAHVGHPDTEECIAAGGLQKLYNNFSMFLHCPSSWKDLWVGTDGVFKPQDVIVWATMKERDKKIGIQPDGDPTIHSYRLVWSVTRV